MQVVTRPACEHDDLMVVFTRRCTQALTEPHEALTVAVHQLIVKDDIEKLGFVEDPMALLAGARAVAVLSELGYGVKTKILDAIAARYRAAMQRIAAG